MNYNFIQQTIYSSFYDNIIKSDIISYRNIAFLQQDFHCTSITLRYNRDNERYTSHNFNEGVQQNYPTAPPIKY
jgi:hypothetical protein